MRKHLSFALVLALSTTAACRDSSGGDDTPMPDGSSTGDDVTIQEIQNDAMTPGTPVTVRGVVVTAIDNFGDRKGDIWVQEPGGGEFSGVQVYGAPLDQIATLQLGDVVDITGAQKAEFAHSTDTSGNTITELEPISGGMMTVTKISSGTPLEPTVVDAIAIGKLTDFKARHAEWEKWEGVLITVKDVAAQSAPECITSMGNCPDASYQRFDLTGDIVVQSALAAMPTPEVALGDCFTSVTGVVGYFFDYHILPRTTAEIGTGGSACPVENTSATCTDGEDNDANGYADCADHACILGASECRTESNISDIQTATTPPTGGVQLTDVYVAAISHNKKNMWVQTNLQAAPNEGIYVRGPGNDLDGFAVGSTVTIIGTVEEFKGDSSTETLTQVKALSIEAGTGTAGTIVPVTGVAVADMSNEPYEATLVTLTNVKVTMVGTTQGSNHTFGVGEATQYPGATVFKTDDDIHRLTTADACYAEITGVWTYLPFNDSWGFLPLANGTGDGTCQ